MKARKWQIRLPVKRYFKIYRYHSGMRSTVASIRECCELKYLPLHLLQRDKYLASPFACSKIAKWNLTNNVFLPPKIFPNIILCTPVLNKNGTNDIIVRVFGWGRLVSSRACGFVWHNFPILSNNKLIDLNGDSTAWFHCVADNASLSSAGLLC